MAQTRMFRDRVVSMEQTLEGGEKHLALLKDLCREALPGFEYAEHALDHERDLFVMELRSPDGSSKKIAWTRMVLFDAERIPTLTGDSASLLRGKIVEFLKARAAKPEILVTFRHLEEGWVDTPEPRREGGGRRRRRGGRGGRGGERGGQDRQERPERKDRQDRPDRQDRRPGGSPSAGGGDRRPGGQRPPSPAPARAAAAGPGGGPPAGAGASGGAEGPGGGGKRRRRFRRRRRGGRGGGQPGSGSGSGSPPPNPGGGGGAGA
jgi:hypothetical protein